MPAFTLKGKIQLDGSQWKSGLDQAKRSAGRFATDVSSLVRGRLGAAFGAAGLGIAVGNTFQKGGEIRDRSRALGIDPETYQQIDFAAAQSGASIDSAAKAIKRLAVAQSDAKRGSKDLQEAFGRYGLTVEQLKRIKPDKLFFLIAEQVERGVNKANQLADMQKLLGRSGADLIPAFETGFSRAAQDAVDRNTVIGAEDVMALARVGDEMLTKQRQIALKTAEAAGAGVRLAEKPLTAEDVAALLMDATGSKSGRQRELEAILETKQATREIAENTRPLKDS